MAVGPRLKTESKVSLGLGMAPGPEAESAVLEAEGTPAMGQLDASVNYLQKSQEGENSAGFQMTWTYSTAGGFSGINGQGYAGQQSDVFFMPTFSIVYRYVDM